VIRKRAWGINSQISELFMSELLPTAWLKPPSVFVSCAFTEVSQEWRDQLRKLIEEDYGFIPMMSEDGRFVYHPAGDAHISDNVVAAVGNCHLYVLFIGGRYGSQHPKHPGRSVTSLELEKALAENVPTYVYVHRPVWDDYKRFKDKGTKAVYSSDIEVVRFVGSLIDRGCPVRPFERAQDIFPYLKQQLANVFGALLMFRRRATWACNEEYFRLREIAARKIYVLTPELHYDVDDAEYSRIVLDNMRAGARYFYLTESTTANRQKVQELQTRVASIRKPKAFEVCFVPSSSFVVDGVRLVRSWRSEPSII
jgi:uncharacterized protein DUF4062